MSQAYWTQATQYGLNLINQHVLNGNQAFILNGWYIALGTGNLTPSLGATALVNKIFDKNSAGYPGITIGDDNELGRYAQIQIPSTLEGNIITEVGLFDASNNLVLVGNTYINLTEGILQTVTLKLSLKAIPADIDVIEINQSSDFPTNAELTTKLLDYQLLSGKGQANGYAGLDTGGKVPLTQLPSTIANTSLSNLSLATALGNLGFAGQSLTANGYYKLPNGFILQWGVIGPRTMFQGDISLTFPIAFPTDCFGVFPIFGYSTYTNGSFGVYLDSKSTTGAVFQEDSGQDTIYNAYIYWLAIGY